MVDWLVFNLQSLNYNEVLLTHVQCLIFAVQAAGCHSNVRPVSCVHITLYRWPTYCTLCTKSTMHLVEPSSCVLLEGKGGPLLQTGEKFGASITRVRHILTRGGGLMPTTQQGILYVLHHKIIQNGAFRPDLNFRSQQPEFIELSELKQMLMSVL